MQAKKAGYSAKQAKNAGYTAKQAKEAGYSVAELLQAAFDLPKVGTLHLVISSEIVVPPKTPPTQTYHISNCIAGGCFGVYCYCCIASLGSRLFAGKNGNPTTLYFWVSDFESDVTFLCISHYFIFHFVCTGTISLQGSCVHCCPFFFNGPPV